jgi:hypothetical protein
MNSQQPNNTIHSKQPIVRYQLSSKIERYLGEKFANEYGCKFHNVPNYTAKVDCFLSQFNRVPFSQAITEIKIRTKNLSDYNNMGGLMLSYKKFKDMEQLSKKFQKDLQKNVSLCYLNFFPQENLVGWVGFEPNYAYNNFVYGTSFNPSNSVYNGDKKVDKVWYIPPIDVKTFPMNCQLDFKEVFAEEIANYGYHYIKEQAQELFYYKLLFK